MSDESKPRLGRGLAALLGDTNEELRFAEPINGIRQVPIEHLSVNPRNPRKNFSSEGLGDLAQSIKVRGVLQPILVRAKSEEKDRYEIIAGERRWRAAQRAGLHEVPIVKIEATDSQALEIAIVENVQRADLNPLEEAEGYERLISEFAYSHHQLAESIGKSRSYISNTLRLLKLPEETRKMLAEGSISAGHARSLISLDNANDLAKEIVQKGLSVREAESLASDARSSKKRGVADKEQGDVHVTQIEKLLSDSLGMNVKLQMKGERGEVRIHFVTLEQLDLICNKLQN